MRTASGYKTTSLGATAHDRGLVNLDGHIEVGIFIPMLDPKFSRSYKLLSASSDHIAGSTKINFNILRPSDANGREICSSYVYDFNDRPIVNFFAGPSSDSEYPGCYYNNPAKRSDAWNENNFFLSTINMLDDPGSVEIALKQNNPLAITRRPDGLRETQTEPNFTIADPFAAEITTKFILRKPNLINVADHTNSILANFVSGFTEYLTFPMTNQGSINPRSLYRFSFYHRVKGTVIVTPIIYFFTNTESFVSRYIGSSRVLSGAATEASDFNFFDLLIPSVSGLSKKRIPVDARRIRIGLKIQATEDSTFELAYPVLEHSYLNSPAVSTVIPEYPSDINSSKRFSSELKVDSSGRLSSRDSTKIFYASLGRNLFEASLTYSFLDSNIVDELRILENYNERGETLVLRPRHHDLPPVMLGNIQMQTTNPLFDFHYPDATINFVEVE